MGLNQKFHQRIFLALCLLVLVLGTVNIAMAKGWFIPEQPKLNVIDGGISLESMTLEQKIAQMIVVHGSDHNLEAWQNMQLGGIHLFAMEDEESFTRAIKKHQRGMSVPFLVTIDFEGCLNPFSNFMNSTAFNEISTVGDAFEKGFAEGKYLKSLGFSLNFAPVVDLDDQIWNCRSFPGEKEDIAELARSYILGLQSQKIIGTAKHYPGRTLVVRDPHKFLVEAEISEEDIYPYEIVAEDVQSIMVSHIITTGEINSRGIPSVVSEEVVGELKQDFNGLIISDEINMLGLRDFFVSLDEMYIAVFKSGNDIILNFNEDPNEVYRMIQVVKGAVESGVISGEAIDNSVRKILEAKGLSVE